MLRGSAEYGVPDDPAEHRWRLQRRAVGDSVQLYHSDHWVLRATAQYRVLPPRWVGAGRRYRVCSV